MLHGELTVSEIEQEQKSAQQSLNLKEMYKKIVDKEIEISDINSTLRAFNYEKKSINNDELVVYRCFREEKNSEEVIAKLAGGGGAGLGLMTAVSSGATLLTMGAFALGGAVLGAGAIALNGYIKNNWLAPVNIEYKDVQFAEVKPVYSGGKFAVIESKPEQGIYQAQFYPEVSSYAKLNVEILVKKKLVPRNAKRIEEIDKEIEVNQQSLKIKQEELAALNKQKEIVINEEILRKEAAKKAKYSAFFKTKESPASGVASAVQIVKPCI